MSPMSLAGISCIAYGRVSTERQAGETQTSLADQELAVNALATTLGVTVGRWYRDKGASGGTMEKRPALVALVADCEASPRTPTAPGLVLVLNDSRWGRFPDPEESAYWRTHLRRLGWVVRFAENDDSQNLTVRSVMRAIVASQATQKREDVRANATRGSRGTAAQGFWGTRSPYGYRRRVVYPPGRDRILEAHQRKAPDEKVVLVPDESEAAIVRELYERYASGTETLASLTDWLRDIAPTRKWTRPAVRYTLTSPAYVGDVVSGRVQAETAQRRPEAEWVTTRDAHPAIVSRALFAACQDVLARNLAWTSRVRTDWLVSGIVLCRCGQPFVAGGGNANRPRVARSYRCVSKSGIVRDRCEYPGTVKKEWLESAVLDTIAAFVSHKSQRARLLRHLDAALAEVRRAPKASASALEQQIAEQATVRNRLVKAVADGTLTGAEAKERLTHARRLLSRLESQRDALARDVTSQRALDAERDRIAALALDFRRAATVLHGPALRELVRPWIAQAVFDTATRELTLDIRHIPAFAHGDLTQMPFPPSQKHAPVSRRIVRVGAR
jgi:DNA invertase Pin-like site-specific DNA recombinase